MTGEWWNFFTIYIIAFLRNWIRVFSDWKVTIPITQVLLWGKLSVIPRQDKILIFSQLWQIFYFLPGLMLMWWIMKNCDTFKHVIFHCSLLRKQPHCARWRMENIWRCILCMSQLLLLGKVEYGGGPIFKVVLEC